MELAVDLSSHNHSNSDVEKNLHDAAGSDTDDCFIIQRKGGLSSLQSVGFASHLLLTRPLKNEPIDVEDDVAIISQSCVQSVPLLGSTVSRSRILAPQNNPILGGSVHVRESVSHSIGNNHGRFIAANQSCGSGNAFVRPVNIQPSSNVRFGAAGSGSSLGTMYSVSNTNSNNLRLPVVCVDQSGPPLSIASSSYINPQSLNIRLVQSSSSGATISASGVSKSRPYAATGPVSSVPTSGSAPAGPLIMPTSASPTSNTNTTVVAPLSSATSQMITNLLQQNRQLESRSILGHSNSLEPFDVASLTDCANMAGKLNIQFKCVECCDAFFDRSSYQRHRERVSVLILYNCEPCQKRLTFYNKCALFTHVRMHKQGSIDPSRLSIHVLTLAKTKNLMQASMRHHIEAMRRENADIESRIANLTSKIEESNALLNEQQQQQLQEPSAQGDEVCSAENGASECASAGGVAEAPTPPVPSGTEKDCDVTVTGFTQNSLAAVDVPTSSNNIATVTSLSGTSCPICNEQLPVEQSLKAHLLQGPERECALCLMRVVGSTCAFKAHLAFHLGVPRVCPECGWTVPDKWSVHRINESMRRHQRTSCFHFQRVRVYLCQRCQTTPRAFSSLKQLVEHILSVHVERFCRCAVCRVAFPLKYSEQLTQHMRMVHNTFETSNTRPTIIVKCPLCNDVYEELESLSKHVHTHLANNLRCQVFAFKCLDRCKQIFMDQLSLAKHRRICKIQRETAEQKGLPCLLCDKSHVPRYFLRARDVLHHERLHLHMPSDAGVLCPWCSQRLITKDIETLLSHLRRHFNNDDKVILAAVRFPNEMGLLPDKSNELCDSVSLLDSDEEGEGENDGEEMDEESTEPCVAQAHNSSSNTSLTSVVLTASTAVPVSCTSTNVSTASAPAAASTSVTAVVPFQCHCGQNISTFAGLQEHCASEQGRLHPVVPEARYTQATEDTFQCSACEKILEGPSLIEHIFADHTSLCYFCNHARLTMRHLWECLQLNEVMRGVVPFTSKNHTHTATYTTTSTTAAAATSINSQHTTDDAAANMRGSEFHCDMCNSACSSEEDLRIHFKTTHGLMRRHACAVCGSLFDSLDDLRSHTLKAHCPAKLFNESYACWLCTKNTPFSTRSALEMHIVRAHRVAKADINWSQMPSCRGLTSASIKRAASTETDGSLQGDDVACNSPSPLSIVAEGGAAAVATATNQSETEQNSVSCAENSVKRLRLIDSYSSDSEAYFCAHCDFSCVDRSRFVQHIVQHRSDLNLNVAGSLQCTECGLLFASRLSVQLHLTAVHRVPDSAAYVKRHYDDMILPAARCQE